MFYAGKFRVPKQNPILCPWIRYFFSWRGWPPKPMVSGIIHGFDMFFLVRVIIFFGDEANHFEVFILQVWLFMSIHALKRLDESFAKTLGPLYWRICSTWASSYLNRYHNIKTLAYLTFLITHESTISAKFRILILQWSAKIKFVFVNKNVHCNFHFYWKKKYNMSDMFDYSK